MCKHFINEAFLGKTDKGEEEETNKNVIFGKVLTSTQCCQGGLKCKLQPSFPTLGMGEGFQTPASVIGSGLLGRCAGREGTPGTFQSLLSWAKRLKGNPPQSCRYRSLEENTHTPVEPSKSSKWDLNRPQTTSAIVLFSTVLLIILKEKFLKHPPNLKNGI